MSLNNINIYNVIAFILFIFMLILAGVIGYNLKAKEVIDLMGSNNQFNDFVELLNNFSDSHNYSSDYNCVNYSRDFKELAKSNNFLVSSVIGCKINDSNKCHEWIRATFDFEPMSGKPVDYSDTFIIEHNFTQRMNAMSDSD